MMEKIVYVGFGEYKISEDPEEVLTALGLGSCVAVTLWCPSKKIGGMVHVVLPSSDGHTPSILGKYADTGIPVLLDKMIRMGARKSGMIVKLAGGAEILRQNYPLPKLAIGEKNSAACEEVLQRLKLRIAAKDVGGLRSRQVKFLVKTGEVMVKTMSGIFSL
ncbi:MAG: chemotaxis protein CheD [Firmicutes bacterium]|nr:chemotaxis protein CheD [Bacillota bacterium]